MRRNRLWLWGLLFFSVAAASHARAQLTFQETKALTDTLFIGNLTPQDLQFSRRPFSDKYSIPFVNLTIDKPLEGADKLMALHERAAGVTPHELLRMARVDVLG